jgi:hypothetical protein
MAYATADRYQREIVILLLRSKNSLTDLDQRQDIHEQRGIPYVQALAIRGLILTKFLVTAEKPTFGGYSKAVASHCRRVRRLSIRMNISTFAAITVVLLDFYVGARYCTKLIRKEISPHIAT